jgi:hypothetical protein
MILKFCATVNFFRIFDLAEGNRHDCTCRAPTAQFAEGDSACVLSPPVLHRVLVHHPQMPLADTMFFGHSKMSAAQRKSQEPQSLKPLKKVDSMRMFNSLYLSEGNCSHGNFSVPRPSREAG